MAARGIRHVVVSEEPADGDRERWNARWAARTTAAMAPPDPDVLLRLDALGPGGGRRALDVASGDGRHALHLARRGFAVTAWDVSDLALDSIAAHAAQSGLDVTTLQVDLASSVPAFAADLVVIVDYLNRPLLRGLSALLAPAGRAVVATFTTDWPEAHPSARFRLERGELGSGLPGLSTIEHRETGGRAIYVGYRPPG